MTDWIWNILIRIKQFFTQGIDMNFKNILSNKSFQSNISGSGNSPVNIQGDNNKINMSPKITIFEKYEAIEKISQQLCTIPRAMQNIQAPKLKNRRESWDLSIKYIRNDIHTHANKLSEKTQEALVKFYETLQRIEPTPEAMATALPSIEKTINNLLAMLEAEKD